MPDALLGSIVAAKSWPVTGAFPALRPTPSVAQVVPSVHRVNTKVAAAVLIVLKDISPVVQDSKCVRCAMSEGTQKNVRFSSANSAPLGRLLTKETPEPPARSAEAALSDATGMKMA